MLLSLMATTELSLSQLNARIPATTVISRSIAVPWLRRGAAMRCVRQHAEGADLDTLDGIRVLEPDGSWCLVLPEDAQASFTLFAEASDSEAAIRMLDHWQSVVEAAS
jgi:mannose-1-phosphate guanylyltransferase / phosphomannomutase